MQRRLLADYGTLVYPRTLPELLQVSFRGFGMETNKKLL